MALEACDLEYHLALFRLEFENLCPEILEYRQINQVKEIMNRLNYLGHWEHKKSYPNLCVKCKEG